MDRYMKNANKGQSMLEYTLLMGAVIAVLVIVLLKEGGMKSHIEKAYTSTGEAMKTTVAHLMSVGGSGAFSH